MPPALLTLAEAARFLDPPLSEGQLRLLTTALRIRPAGRRKTGRRGHPVDTYDAAELMRLHAAVSPWLAGCDPFVPELAMTG